MSRSDQPPSALSRKLLHASTHPPSGSPRDSGQPPPRGRAGFGPSFDGVLNGGEAWVARRKSSDGAPKSGGAQPTRSGSAEQEIKGLDIHEEEQEQEEPPQPMERVDSADDGGGDAAGTKLDLRSVEAAVVDLNLSDANASVQDQSTAPNFDHTSAPLSVDPPPGLPDMASMEWSYLDPQGHVQGIFPPCSLRCY
jgi:PERQ amino acid-rich with GYF domain-containing protein